MKLRLIVVIPLFLMLLLTPLPLVGWTGVSPQETTSEITVPWASSAEADGYIKAGEWDDALEIDLSNATWKAYLYLKHDNKSLYLFLDHVSDTISNARGYDNCWVAIDVLSDDGNETKEDDYLFHSSGHHISIGYDGGVSIPGGQWDELWGHGEVPSWLEPKVAPFRGKYGGSGPGAFGVSPKDLDTPHSLFEIKIPITGWEIEEANRTFGFCVAAGSPGTTGDFLAKVVWPSTAYDDYTGDFYTGGISAEGIFENPEGSFSPPSTWGTITLSDVPPPTQDEPDYWLYIVIAVIAVVIIAAVVLLLRKRR